MGRAKEKLLVKIEQDGTVVQRRLSKHDQLSIGQHPKCDVTVYGQQFPKKHILFAGKNSHFQMNLKDYIKGEVVAGDSRLSFKDMLVHNLLPKKGDTYLYPITQGKKGVVVVGDAKITFLCTNEGALPPEKHKPKFIGFSWVYATLKELGRDLPFKAIFLVVIGLHVLLLKYMSGLPEMVSAVHTRNVVPERLARIIVKQPDQPVVEKRTGATAGSAEAEAEPDATRKKQRKNSKPVRPESQGILGLLTGIGSSGNASGLADFLLDKGLVKELEQMMSETELTIGQGTIDRSDDFDNLIAASDLGGGIDDILGALDDVETVSLGEKGQIQIDRIGSMTGSQKALGSRTEESVRAVLLAYTGRLTYIYNKYLKRDPGLKGKMVVEVVIAASGSVASARLATSTMGNAEFEREVLSFIRRWKYDDIDEGEVTVTYPLFFNKV
ncbi:MAG: AgmX/PglI C-terminal domain-containing protein [Calditrichaeota bacterium]|nr:AgmX/PglI C-terminal domain-containing protein [Calditrichota bacterium]